MGSQQSIRKCNFEDVQYGIHNLDKIVIINTMSSINQECLIKGTTKINEEEALINKLVSKNIGCKILVYGLNNNDKRIFYYNVSPRSEQYQNKKINPLTLKLPSGKILKGKELERFNKNYKMILANHLNNLFE